MNPWLHFLQNGQNLKQFLFSHLKNFGGKVRKIFWSQTFGFDQISYRFVSFMTKIFCSAWISQIPSHGRKCAHYMNYYAIGSKKRCCDTQHRSFIITTISITTLSIMPFIITANQLKIKNSVTLNNDQHDDTQYWVLFVIWMSSWVSSFNCNAECYCDEHCNAEHYYNEYRYAECRGDNNSILLRRPTLEYNKLACLPFSNTFVQVQCLATNIISLGSRFT